MARRVNKKFLIILTCIVVGGGVALLAAGKLLFRHTPQEFVDAGDKYMQQHDYELAIRNYLQAHSMRPSDPAILIKVGDAFELRSVEEPAYSGKDRAAWNQALEAQTDYVPALERLFAVYKDDAQASSRPEVFDRVRDIGRRLSAAKPDDISVKAYVASIPVRRLAAGIAVSDEEVDGAVKQLQELRAQDAALADPPFWIAQAKLLRAADRQQAGYSNESRKLRDEAIALFDVAQKDQAQNAELHLRAYQVFTALARTATTADERTAMAQRAQHEIDLARQVVKNDDPNFIDICLTIAQQAASKGDVDAAEKVLRQLVKDRPDDQSPRLALAKLIGAQPAKRAEAIALLSEPVKPAERAYKTQQYELVTLVEQTNLRLDDYTTLKDDASRKAAAAAIDSNLKKLDNSIPNSSESLRLHGRWSLVQGNVTDAIQQLNRAVNTLAQNNQPKNYDLMYLLARAYMAGNQTGQAKTLLNEIVTRFPTVVPARLMLAQLLARENAIPQLQEQVSALEQLDPGSDELQRLQLALYRSTNQSDKARALYNQMPESSDAQYRAKAQVAVALANYADAIRLLELVHQKSPADVNVTQALAQVYITANQKDKAVALVDAALKAAPDSVNLVLLQKSLANATPQELIEQIPDEFTREMRWYELAAAQNQADKALEHLKKAQVIKPEDTQVLAALFQYYVQTRDWKTAEQFVDQLTKIDADHAQGATYRFRLAMAQGKIDDATRIARDLTSSMGEFSQSWQLLGQALAASGHFDEAASRYAMAIEKQSENLEAYRGIIQCYYALGDANSARRYIEQGRRVFPRDASLHELQIQYDLNYGNPEQAVAEREAQQKANADNAQAWLNLGQAYLRAAQARANQRDSAGAQTWINKAQALFKQAADKWPDEPNFYAMQAEIALTTGQFQQGLDALNTLAARDNWKDRFEPQQMLGEYYARSGKIAEAENAYRQALRLSGNAVEVELKLSSLLSQAGKVDEALKVLDTHADDGRVLTQRIAILMGSRQFSEAEKLINSSLEKDPNNPDLLKNLAAIYLSTNRKDLASERLKTVLASHPDDAVALRFTAMIHLMDDQPDQAIAILIQLRQTHPNDVDVRYQLARAYRVKSQLDSATRELEAALKVQPLNKTIRSELVEVDSQLKRWSDVERLLTEAQAMPVYAGDADWPHAEAMMWVNRGDWNKAAASIQKAIKLQPQNMQLVEQYLNILVAAKAYQPVLDETAGLVQGGKAPWWVYQLRGVAYYRMDNKTQAVQEFEKALNSSQTDAHQNVSTRVAQLIAREMGVDETLTLLKDRIDKESGWKLFAVYLYQSAGRNDEALKLLEPLAAQFDQLPADQQDGVLRYSGLVYGASNAQTSLGKAEDAYTKLLKKYPNDLTALNNIACLLVDKLNQSQRALAYSEQAYKLTQQSGQVQPLILDTYGWCLIQTGQVDQGIGLLQQALDQQSFADGHYHLAVGYLKQKNAAEAQRHLTIASGLIEQAEKNSQPVDPQLKQRVQEAAAQADSMLKDKGQASAG